MADRRPGPGPASGDGDGSNLRRFLPNSTQMVTLAILIALTGLTLTGAVLGFILFAPLILISSPIWVPVAALMFVVAAGVLSTCLFSVAAVAVATWTYRYISGRHPVGSERVDYARSRIADTASHVKDYAREYGGCRVKDAAPGA